MGVISISSCESERDREVRSWDPIGFRAIFALLCKYEGGEDVVAGKLAGEARGNLRGLVEF